MSVSIVSLTQTFQSIPATDPALEETLKEWGVEEHYDIPDDKKDLYVYLYDDKTKNVVLVHAADYALDFESVSSTDPLEDLLTETPKEELSDSDKTPQQFVDDYLEDRASEMLKALDALSEDPTATFVDVRAEFMRVFKITPKG